MNKIKIALLASIATLAVAPAFAAEPAGPYLSLGGGLSLPEGSGVDIRTTSPTSAITKGKVTFDNGYMLSGAAGYRFDGGFRTELEVNYRRNTVNDINDVAAVGRQGILGVMGNLVYDFNIDNAMGLTPYVGAGAGPSWNKWTNVQSPTLGTPVFTDRDFAWQWQAIAGISIPVSEQLVAFTEYRYMGTILNKFDSVPAGFEASRHSARSHNFLLGLRWNFGSAPAKEEMKTAAAAPPPPPPPPPPAPPPPPPVPQKFLVFFDFDKSSVRADAQKIVQEAADYAKKNGKARITATGHADTSGPAPYNMALSERRAKAVKASLVKLGFKESEIVVMYKGESEPLVATGDGVKEPQNRRVEIVME